MMIHQKICLLDQILNISQDKDLDKKQEEERKKSTIIKKRVKITVTSCESRSMSLPKMSPFAHIIQFVHCVLSTCHCENPFQCPWIKDLATSLWTLIPIRNGLLDFKDWHAQVHEKLKIFLKSEGWTSGTQSWAYSNQEGLSKIIILFENIWSCKAFTKLCSIWITVIKKIIF